MANTEKIVSKDPAEKLAFKRLSVLQLAEALGSVTEACRHGGMDRTSFYAWKKRFAESGLDGLKDLSNAPHHHPFTTPPEVEAKLIETAFEHPGWGCTKLSDYLRLHGFQISSPSAQKILIRHGMGSKYERLIKLEERHLKQGFELNDEQIRQIEKMNPVFKERHVESSAPGELLCQDTKTVGSISGIGRIYLHAVVDSYGSYAFGFLYTSKIPEAAIAVLHNEVIPCYQKWNLPIQAVLTDNGREFCGTDAHPFELYLRLNDIEHRTTRVRSPRTNGFVERFNRTVSEDFVQKAFRTKLYTSVEELQIDFDKWLYSYNYERPHRGYRNLGKRPIDTVQAFIKKSKEDVRHQG